MALLRDQVLATLPPAQNGKPQPLQAMIVGLCALCGEQSGLIRQDVRTCGEQLARLSQQHGSPPAVQILSAYLRSYNLDFKDEEERHLAQTVAASLPPEAAMEGLPPLLRGIGSLIRCRADEDILSNFSVFLGAVLPLADVPYEGAPPKPPLFEVNLSGGGALAVPTFEPTLWRPVLERLVVQGMDELQKRDQSEKPAERLRKLPQWEWAGCYADGARKMQRFWKRNNGAPSSSDRTAAVLLREAEQDLLRSWQLRPDQPLAAGALMEVVRVRGGDRKECNLWFDRMTRARPDFIRGLHTYEWFTLEPRWGGSVEEIRAFAVERLNRGADGTFQALYGLRLLGDSFSKQSSEADWRQIWRRPQVQAALDHAFPALIAEPANAYLQSFLRLQYALLKLYMGRYIEASRELEQIPDAQNMIYGMIGDEAPIAYRWQSWQMIQDEIYANTGPFADRIRAGEELVFAGKKAEGIALWRRIIDECNDPRVATNLRDRAGYILLQPCWHNRGIVFDLRMEPILYAIHIQDIATIRWLLDAGVDPCHACENGNAPLFRAAAHQAPGALQEMLKQGLTRAQLNATYMNQLTPLAAALAENTLEGVRALVEAGADVNQPDGMGQPPVLLACLRDETSFLQYLMKKGANCTAQVPKTGLQPLHLAASSGKEQHVRLLLDAGAEMDACTNDGYTALHLACKEGQRAVAELLLRRGAKPDTRGPNAKDTPLIAAVRQGDAASAELLLNKGADINATAADGGTALYYAAALNRARIVRLLLDRGADPERGVFQKQLTALAVSAHEGYADIVQMLLEKGADPSRKVDGHDALGRAKKGSEDVVLLLRAALAKQAASAPNHPTERELRLQHEEAE